MLPKTPKVFNLFLDGDSWAGKVAEVTLPKLTRKTEDYRGGGMAAPVEIDLGYEKLEFEFTLQEYTADIIKKWGECSADGVPMRLLAGAKRDGGDCAVDNIEIIVRGRPRELDFGNMKPGDLSGLKVPFACSYFKYVLNGETLVELDPVNMIEKIGGVDRYEKLREAIAV
ncbi:MAG: phage major tail tube protein [Robiginitomaculum sp.]|nr:phage major tail tube protein [Robiginitomaculum sp.]